MQVTQSVSTSWADRRVRMDEVTKYMTDGKDFIDDDLIEAPISTGAQTTGCQTGEGYPGQIFGD